MKETVRIALIQFEGVLGNVDANMKHAEELIRSAAKEGAELIVLPELFSTGYNLSMIGQRIPEMAESVDGPSVTKIRNLAAELKVHICAPFPLWLGGKTDRPYNSSVLVDGEGNLLGTYSKCHLYDKERDYFRSGESFPVFETSLGKIGIMICYDAGFPEAARLLKLHGAELILCPSAWNQRDKAVWFLNMPQRSLENTVYLAAVNRFGHEGDLCMGGFSLVTGPGGEILAVSTAETEEILYADLSGAELNHILKTDGGVYMAWRRPELYRKEGLTE